MRNSAFLYFIIFLLFAFSPIQKMAAQATGKSTAVKTTGKPLSLSGAEIQAAYAVDLTTGQTLYNYNGDQRLTPASITKLFPTGAALLTLGPKARLRTEIGLTRDTTKLVIHGVFDPTTDSYHFNTNQLSATADTLAERLKELGITHLEHIVADATRGLTTPYNAQRLWEDIGNYYGAAPSALTADDNTVRVFFSSPATEGELCTVDSVIPRINDMRPVSYVKSYKGTSDLCYLYLAGDKLWYADGKIPKGKKAFAVRGAMPQPELHYAQKLAALLRTRGIEIDSVEVWRKGVNLPEDSTIASVWSPTIAEICKTTNSLSVNLFADALSMAILPQEAEVSWDEARRNLKIYWNQKLGFAPYIFDASGLSPVGALSPKQLVKLLTYMNKSKVATSFYESLPIMGRTGTLASLGTSSSLAGRVHAKSGTLTGVVAYAGYIEHSTGQRTAFCIIVNHFTETTGDVRRAIVKWLEQIDINTKNN